MRGATTIFCALGCLFAFLGGPTTALAVQPPLDETYVKPASGTWWGGIFRRYFRDDRFGKSYALVIGVGDYVKDWRKLEAPPTDARRVRDFLIKDAGFDYVVTLTDSKATEARIEQVMEEVFPELVGRNDRFLFYYSGHGTQRPLENGGFMGYLPLRISGKKSFASMIAMTEIERWDRLLGKAKQALFVLDSCFSGLAGIEVKGDAWEEKTVERLAQYGHHLITAGTAGEVSVASTALGGGSLFTDSFLKAVSGKGDARSEFPTDGVVSLKELMTYIGRRIDFEATRLKRAHPGRREIRMSPQIRDLQQNAGEFFFITADFKKKKAGPRRVSGFKHGLPQVATKGQVTEGLSPTPPPDPAAIELEFWRSVKDSTNPAMLEEFLRQFPYSRFSGLARLKLKELKGGHVASRRLPTTKLGRHRAIPEVYRPSRPLPVITDEQSVSGVVAILAGSIGASRLGTLRAISNKIKTGLSGEEAAQILKGIEPYRSEGAKYLSAKLVALSGADAVTILARSIGASRLRTLRAISNKIKTGLSGKEVAQILEGIEPYRSEATSLLFK